VQSSTVDFVLRNGRAFLHSGDRSENQHHLLAVRTEAEGNHSIAIRSIRYLCRGIDRRHIDGTEGSKFMLEFKKTLENWEQEIG
jgi:pyruvate/2-oxoglutarate dehydrogenase complex dihydrolipoamide acyltransferase (E2) component